ncbi:MULTISPECIES: gliding motility-associated C-terminal domain-containing protein [Aequorivita]|uniref:Gliding motility-associated C-terminal domain-containing protein n=1 Tax=Aequorivita iocasae TaxID=2803865 RepID=A0ABX7DPH0_9FLAO|nr:MULTISPECIES: gliding motility-associated C-terminal domain-containing protein [Aequorivita]QQX75652.1 gliding motility-associated C-terminal domain-containing protein [Aequorivita iocasae]UCA55108.1 gliding motility-associated C-terminal domain-containing protein [Aequorivita sp. F7]
MKYIFSIFCLFIFTGVFSQDISLFRQFNGQYDYTAFGNTLNVEENGQGGQCFILTSSSANFQLQSNQEVVAAYLYWAGSGPGDFNVTFNQVPITAERTFNESYNSGGQDYIYFSAFADVTEQIQTTGNGNYTLSDLDLTLVIPAYCSPPGSGTNFGGWAVTVVYEDVTLPNNQVNIFDGLQSVSRVDQTLEITLSNLMVLDTEGAKIGFLAWEGDRGLAVNETLRINGNILSNLPLNPPDNAFNGTNSFTGSDVLYNMDIDVYPISNYISPGDTSATIQLTSGQDFVMVNNIITVLNTQLPDATISIDNIIGGTECGNRELTIDYTVYNFNSTDILPAGTPIAFYADETLVAQSATVGVIPIDGQESGTVTFTVPSNIESDFILKAIVDDTGNGSGIVDEINEENNEDETSIHLLLNPIITGLRNLETCDVIGEEFFDLTESTSQIDPVYELSFHLSEADAQNNENPIANPENFQNTENPETIYIRVSNPDCFLVDSFAVEVVPCPLPDATIELPEISACRDRELLLPFTVYNLEATAPLPANTSIAFYTNGLLLGLSQTQQSLPIGSSENGEVELLLPDSLPNTFTIIAVVDDDGNGNGAVEEFREDNNSFKQTISFESIPPIPNLPNLLECDTGFDTAIFDLTQQDDLISTGNDDVILYFTTMENALENTNPISNPTQYQNGTDPQSIYVRLENEICFTTASFLLTTQNCAPFIPQGFSPNGDGINDTFEISNLLNIYENFELNIYSREGNLIHTAHNVDGFWDGVATKGLLFTGSTVPVGTYYYVLVLNDPKYPEAFIGWVYVNY